MLEKIDIEQILLLDIETIPQYANYADVPEKFKSLWDSKTAFQRKDVTAEAYYEKAGILAEFGKIICVSVGRIKLVDTKPTLRIKSFFGHSEKELLSTLSTLLFKLPNKVLLCAHNGKEFDFPYLCRRFLINTLPLPPILNISSKKPWEIPHLDTLEIWKFGDYKHYTSLELLASIFDIESPKKELDGSKVKEVYYQENDLARIVEYCQKDVVTLGQLLLKWKNLASVASEDITIVE